jgi:RimJ/RimL family protein N-acetyltransferase
MQAGDVELHAPGIVLRRVRADEAPMLLEAVRESMDTVGRWMSWCNESYSIQEATAWIDRQTVLAELGTAYEFGVFGEDSGRFYGCAGLNCIIKVNRIANLGYWVRRSAEGQGVTTSAARCLVEFGFTKAGLSRIEIVASVENLASRRIAEKLGALFEGVLRNRLVVGGVAVPAALYSFVPNETGS